MDEKLQKVLARAGLGSRRELETWIQAGRVSVNGAVAQLGDRVRLDARITVDGRPIASQRLSPRRRILIYHKPVGEVCSRHDPEGRETIFAALPRLRDGRWISVGRLDLNTSGLLLITNDGELANVLMHPSHEVEREYAVRVRGEATQETLAALSEGIELEDGPARFDSIRDGGGQGSNHWYHVSLREGRNREVRRLWEARSVEVSRLIRVRYGSVVLPRALRAGHWEELGPEDTEALLRSVGIVPQKEEPARGARGRKSPGGRPTRTTPGGRGKAGVAAQRGGRAEKPISKRYPRMVEDEAPRSARRSATATRSGRSAAKSAGPATDKTTTEKAGSKARTTASSPSRTSSTRAADKGDTQARRTQAQNGRPQRGRTPRK